MKTALTIHVCKKGGRIAAVLYVPDFEEKALNESLPGSGGFYSDSCVACKKLAPVLGNAEDDYEDKIKVYKVNTNFDGTGREV